MSAGSSRAQELEAFRADEANQEAIAVAERWFRDKLVELCQANRAYAQQLGDLVLEFFRFEVNAGLEKREEPSESFWFLAELFVRTAGDKDRLDEAVDLWAERGQFKRLPCYFFFFAKARRSIFEQLGNLREEITKLEFAVRVVER